MTSPPKWLPPFVAVFDCNTLIQAMAYDAGPAGACIALVESGRIDLHVSQRTLAELRRVARYSEIRAISPQMTDQRIDAFLEWLLFRPVLVSRVPHRFKYPRDPDDEPYINLALAAHADYLVTSDRELLDLKTGYSAPCKRFRRMAHRLHVVTPAELLEIVRRRDLEAD
jgi:putative PIN family toxin of toxin-antitoxin system